MFKKILKNNFIVHRSTFNVQRGVAVYLAIVIMFLLLGIGVGLATILIGQIKIMSGIGDSVVAFYAADTGIERALYEDKRCKQTPCPAYCLGYQEGYCLGIPDGYDIPTTDLGDASYKASHTHTSEGPPACADYVDINGNPGGDGIVTSADVIVITTYGFNECTLYCPGPCPPSVHPYLYDLNGDCRVTSLDISVASGQVGACDYLSFKIESTGTFQGTKRAIEINY